MEQKVYKAIPIPNVQFSIDELKRMGIAYLDSLVQLKDAMDHLGIKNINPNKELFDYGYILSQIGSLYSPTWALYRKDDTLERILDIRDRKNFYTLILVGEESEEVVFDKIHIREEHAERDLAYYIKLDLETRSGPYPIHSEFLQ